jgi:membrane-associated phospholipid phosphatase
LSDGIDATHTLIALGLIHGSINQSINPLGLDGRIGHGYAMPSSHTQFIFFFLFCGAIHMYNRYDTSRTVRQNVEPTNTQQPMTVSRY